MPNFVKIGPSIADILRFLNYQDGGLRHLAFSKSQNFIGWCVDQRAYKHHCAKSSKAVNPLQRYCFFKMAAVRRVEYRPTAWSVSHCAKFGYDRCSIMNISIFGAFGWKTLIYVPKLGF